VGGPPTPPVSFYFIIFLIIQGIALFRTGNIEGGIACFREAVRINPNYIHAKNNLNQVLMMQKQNK